MDISLITPHLVSRRPQLTKMVIDVNALLTPADEHIIICDTPAPFSYTEETGIYSTAESPIRVIVTKMSKDSVYGNVQRDLGVMLANRHCIVFCDDDDVLCKEGVDVLHSLPPDDNTCHLFRMMDGGKIYGVDDISVGMIGGPQIVVPNRDDLPKWTMDNKRESDFWFIRECLGRYDVVKHREILCVVRP